eukprot:scaffold81800_cov30-Cyclotella_meneghiniana.AAC.1
MLKKIKQSCIWSNGPFPAGLRNDGELFWGGKLSSKKDDWDQSSLYFSIPPGKKAIGDSAYGGTPEKCTIAMDGHNKIALQKMNRVKARQESYIINE